jgi:hypothetical protein
MPRTLVAVNHFGAAKSRHRPRLLTASGMFEILAVLKFFLFHPAVQVRKVL